MDTALPQKFPFILDRNLAQRKSGLHVLWYSSPWNSHKRLTASEAVGQDAQELPQVVGVPDEPPAPGHQKTGARRGGDALQVWGGRGVRMTRHN